MPTRTMEQGSRERENIDDDTVYIGYWSSKLKAEQLRRLG